MKKIFVAYQGCEYNEDEIEKVLEEKLPKRLNWEVKTRCIKEKNVVYAKFADKFALLSEPDLSDAFLTVSGFDNVKARKANNYFECGIGNYDFMFRIISKLYGRFEEKAFEKLSPYMDFCSVIYDRRNNTMIAGLTKHDDASTYLYYGYTRENREIMFSNDESTLKEFCEDVYEMKENTYMKDGVLFTLDGKKEDLVSTKVENSIDSFLPLEEIKQKISDYISRELDNETKKQILTIIKDEVKSFNLKEEITTELGKIINKKIVEYTNNIAIPTVHIIKLKDKILGQTKSWFYHKSFEEILEHVELDEPIMLIGPAGSGKNVSIAQVADALGKKMYYTNNASNEFKLTGFIDAGGNYRQTEFYKAFKNGGVFFLDEIDCSDPSALIVINSALANGYMAFPHETIDKHPDFRIITAANTWGKGADLEYVGRNSLDASTLDRFDTIFFEYDEKLEQSLYPNDSVLEFMWSFRRAVLESRIHHIVSTRGIGKVYKKEINGISVERALTSNIVKNLNQDDVNTIIGNMKNVSSDNKYYEGIKCLKLKR